MDSERAISWLEKEGFNQWRLNRGEKEKVAEYTKSEETFEESIEKLRETLPLQAPGEYLLNAYKGHGKQAAKSTFRFVIQKPENNMSFPAARNENYSYNDILEAAKKLALAEMMEMEFKKNVLARLDALELDMKDIKKSLQEFTDDDDENDGDAVERLSNIGEKLPGLMKGLDSLGGFLQRK
jgi:hypothetical protein